MRILRLNCNEYVLDNGAPRTLAFGPGLLLSGAGVEQHGNLVVAGHRTSWFLPLEKIATGDRIEWEWFDTRRGKLQEREYRVERIVVTTPDDVSLLRSTVEDALTLITCYPFVYRATSPQRFVVRAVPVESKKGA